VSLLASKLAKTLLAISSSIFSSKVLGRLIEGNFFLFFRIKKIHIRIIKIMAILKEFSCKNLKKLNFILKTRI